MNREILKSIRHKISDIDVLLATLKGRFGDSIAPYFSFSELSDEDIILSHTLLHKYYKQLVNNIYKQWRREDIIYFHRQVIKEMNERSILHTKKDDIDNI